MNYIKKHSEDLYELFIQGESEYSGPLKGVLLFTDFHNFTDVNKAIDDMNEKNHNIAEFNLSKHYIKTKYGI